jgi:rhodanese-related sulfurtransferase
MKYWFFIFWMLPLGIFAQNAAVLKPVEFQAAYKKARRSQLIDVRTPEEYQAGHLPKSRNMNFNAEDFKTKAGKLKKKRPVFLYCRSGNRSSKAAKLLTELGFKKVYDMQGGILEWEKVTLPTVK